MQFHKVFGHNCDLLTHCSMKQMEKNMPIKIILARSCIFLGLDFYASISWGARAEEICRTIWVKAKISNSGSFKSIKTIVRSCKCNLKLFKVRPSNACERKSIWTRPIDGKCYQQEIFFDQKPFLLVWQKSKWQTISIYNCEFFLTIWCWKLFAI